MGIPKRLDGQPSRLPVPFNAPRDPQRASCSNSGSASTRTWASQPSLVNQQVSHPSVGPSDSCWLDMLEESKYPGITIFKFLLEILFVPLSVFKCWYF